MMGFYLYVVISTAILIAFFAASKYYEHKKECGEIDKMFSQDYWLNKRSSVYPRIEKGE